MEKWKMGHNEAQIADMLRKEILESSLNLVKPEIKQVDLSDIEYVSKQEQPYVSPIFTMNEDEILAFVEEFEISELATLSVAELNRIGEVLGVEPSILLGMED